MSTAIKGVVHEGRVVPESPLPEGAQVEIYISDLCLELPPDLAEEFETWGRASNRALELIDKQG